MSTVPGCEVVESGPSDAEHTVLLLPGGWCTALFYDELMAEPAVAALRLIAVTLPGNGGTPPPDDLSMEKLRQTHRRPRGPPALRRRGRSQPRRQRGPGDGRIRSLCRTGGAAGTVLLAPRRSDGHQGAGPAGPVLGHLPFRVMRTMMRFAVRDTPLPPARLAVLVGELQKNDPKVMRGGIRRYLQYLDRHGSVATRLGASGVPAWVVHGESGDGGITMEERRTLQAYPQVRIVTIPGRSSSHPASSPHWSPTGRQLNPGSDPDPPSAGAASPLNSHCDENDIQRTRAD